MTNVNSILRSEAPFFLFREPGAERAHLGVCLQAPEKVFIENFESSEHPEVSESFESPKTSEISESPSTLLEGMLVAPFDPSQPAWLMKADRLEEIDIDSFLATQGVGAMERSTAERQSPAPDARASYLAQCRAFIDAIRAGEAEKAILAREVATEKMRRSEAFVYFCKLAKAYPNAFVSLIHLPEAGTWLGATPELLLVADAEGRFKTMSLAGTKPAADRCYETAEAWPAKERREQAIVTEYIAATLRSAQIPFDQGKTEVLPAGAVLHLCTRFDGRIAPGQLPGLIRALHPTPAVCGRPLGPALSLIAREERLSRSLYAGYLGYVGAGVRLYVNLRCARLTEDGATLYVGGGITADSDPQREWEETCLKAQTLLSPFDKP